MTIELKDVQLKTLDVPDINGRIYPKDVIQRAIDKLEENILGLIGFQESIVFSLADAAFVASDLHLDGSALLANIKTLDTPAGRAAEDLLKDDFENLQFAVAGLGNVDDGVVSNFTFLHLGLVPKISKEIINANIT
jgi:hypothetical protein